MSAAPAVATDAAVTPPHRRWWRRILAFAGVVIALVLIAAVTSPWWFNARRVADLATTQAGNATGLVWSYAGEPALRWRPQPWLSLPGLRVQDADGRRVLAAERLDIALPWSTLRGESMRIDALRLVGLDLDLDAAAAWWNARPASDDDAAWPELDGLVLTGGRVHWPGGALENLELTLPRFAIGEPMALALRGRVIDAETAAFALSMQLDATPKATPLRLESFELRLDGTGPIAPTVARGRLQVTPWTLDARGEIASWPGSWPALPAPLSGSVSPLAFTLSQNGGSAMTAPITVTVKRDGAQVKATGTAEAVMAWRDDEGAAALPPLAVRAELPTLDLDGARLDGVTIELDGDEAP